VHRRCFQTGCARCGVTQSRGRVGTALDDAVIESWHSTLEFELRQLEHFTTKAQACRRLATWIQEYNHGHRRSSLEMRSPIDYELALHADDIGHVQEQEA
jgi:putative transposase